MSNTLVFDCPECNSTHITFDIQAYNVRNSSIYELFVVCRRCKKGSCIVATTTYRSPDVIRDNKNCDLTALFTKFIIKTSIPNSTQPPEFLPKELENIFKEAAKCLALNCFNAARAMFRLCLDITTKHLLEQHQNLNPTNNDKSSIHTRLTWIFKNKIIADDLEKLSRCIKNDGNDAAHDGTLGKEESYDLLDFTYVLLERVYTQPEKVRLAEVRRQERHS